MPRVKKSKSKHRKKSSKKVSFKVRKSSKRSSRKSSKKKRVVSKKRTIPKTMTLHPGAALSRGARYSAMGGTLGSALGPLGASIGSAMGALGGGAYGLITGHGNYKMNSILSAPDQVPSFDSHGRHCVRIKHREYIADISTTSSFFTNLTYPINPGNPTLFPWLSTVAGAWEEYRFEGLAFEYKTTSANSVGSTNGTMGFMALATEYNAALPAYTNKTQLENSEFACSGSPYSNIFHPVECKRGENVLGELYVSQSGGTTISGQDPRLYNLGVLNVATGLAQAVYVGGELWATYDVCFYKNKFGYTSGQSVNTLHLYSSGTGVTTSNYFGTAPVVQPGSTFSVSLAGTAITLGTSLQTGNYMISYVVAGASTASVIPPVITFDGTNAKSLVLFAGDTTNSNIGIASTNTIVQNIVAFQVLQPGGTINFANGVLPATITSMDLFIMQFNSLVIT